MDTQSLLDAYPDGVKNLGNLVRRNLLDRFVDLMEVPDLPSRIIVYRVATGNAGIVFTLIPSKKGVKLGFYRGRELPDPCGLMQGNGKVHSTISLTPGLLQDLAFLELQDTAMLRSRARIEESK